MLPLVDCHVHLLAGLDDGPTDRAEAVTMCRMLHHQGVGLAAAVAHQSELFPGVTAERIREAIDRLRLDLCEAGIPLEVQPAGEVMASPDLLARWQSGSLVSLADRGKYLLVEMPHGLFVDLRPMLRQLSEARLSIVLAHAERTEELLFDSGPIEDLISHGAFVQVNASSVTDPPSSRFERALRNWFRRGMVHVLGSDGHSTVQRPPHLAAAVQRVRRWIGTKAAERVAQTFPRLMIQGVSLKVPPPLPQTKRWWSSFW